MWYSMAVGKLGSEGNARTLIIHLISVAKNPYLAELSNCSFQ